MVAANSLGAMITVGIGSVGLEAVGVELVLSVDWFIRCWRLDGVKQFGLLVSGLSALERSNGVTVGPVGVGDVDSVGVVTVVDEVVGVGAVCVGAMVCVGAGVGSVGVATMGSVGVSAVEVDQLVCR